MLGFKQLVLLVGCSESDSAVPLGARWLRAYVRVGTCDIYHRGSIIGFLFQQHPIFITFFKSCSVYEIDMFLRSASTSSVLRCLRRRPRFCRCCRIILSTCILIRVGCEMEACAISFAS